MLVGMPKAFCCEAVCGLAPTANLGMSAPARYLMHECLPSLAVMPHAPLPGRCAAAPKCCCSKMRVTGLQAVRERLHPGVQTVSQTRL